MGKGHSKGGKKQGFKTRFAAIVQRIFPCSSRSNTRSQSSRSVQSEDEVYAEYVQEETQEKNRRLEYFQLRKHEIKILENCTFYHFFVDEKDAEDILQHKETGSFLVRVMKTKTNTFIFCVSMVNYKRFYHLKVCMDTSRKLFLSNMYFADDFHDLIRYHVDEGVPVGILYFSKLIKRSLILINPIARPEWEIFDDEVTIQGVIGKGTFGPIFKGYFRRDGHTSVVAMKGINGRIDEAVRSQFLSECRLMRHIGFHHNIASAYGVTVSTYATTLVLEYCNGGDLVEFLDDKDTTDTTKALILRDCACGLECLQKNNIIHRDLISRNVLLVKRDEEVIRAKISGFGLAREVTSNRYEGDPKESIAVIWSAPECMESRIWHFESDLWMLGMLIWEVFTDGMVVPYYEFKRDGKSSLFDYIKKGKRPIPTNPLPDDVHQILMELWRFEPTMRPPISRVIKFLSDFYKTEKYYDDEELGL